jgi:hypothetical protein
MALSLIVDDFAVLGAGRRRGRDGHYYKERRGDDGFAHGHDRLLYLLTTSRSLSSWFNLAVISRAALNASW